MFQHTLQLTEDVGCQMFGVKLLTFCGCGDGLSVGHGQRDGSHGAVVW